MTVKALQQLLNRFFAALDLPIRVDTDGRMGPRTRQAIRYAQLAAGWRPRYATGRRTPLLYAALRSNGRSMLPVQRRRGLAWREHYRHGNSAAAIARRILNHPRARFAFSSPTGGTARAGIAAIAQGQKAYVAATGERTTIALPILRFLELVLERASGPVFINCVVNGSHRPGSLHYRGEAADLDKTSQVSRGTLDACARDAGVHVLDEDAYHYHVYVGPTP